jgi:hypothetical protein
MLLAAGWWVGVVVVGLGHDGLKDVDSPSPYCIVSGCGEGFTLPNERKRAAFVSTAVVN